jgi:hypothetical protein
MDVYSDIPYRGRVEVALRPDIGGITVLAIRVPSWAGKNATVTEDGVALAENSRWSWNDWYVVIQAVQPGKRYAVRFPMVVQHPPITQLHTQNDWWNEADYGSTANPEMPVQYTGTMIGDTLVSSTFTPTGGLPRYVRPQFSALIQNDMAVETAPPTRSASRFVFNATVQQSPGWTP